MQTAPPHDAAQAVQDFKAKLNECTVQATCKRDFVLVARLTEWMKSKRPGESVSQAACLPRAAYSHRSRDSRPGLPSETDRLSNGHGKQSAFLVFAILLELDSAELIDMFFRYNLHNPLPIDLYQLRDKIGKFMVDTTQAELLAERFNEAQWRYCAAPFDLNMGEEFGRDRIIPICAKEKINTKGGTADLWWIQIPEEFRYVFALKSFKEGNKRIYDNEKNAFLALRHNKSMVKYLGDYGHQELRQPSPVSGLNGNESQEKLVDTHNILLEYGDYDLDEYFAQRLPPVFGPEIESFWRSLFEVADAINGVHNLEDKDGAVQKYRGWHADIKPDNIIIFQGKFKLADPGFATFVAMSGELPKDSLMGGTETFAAPECHAKRADPSTPISQAIDVWSLGCVLSIAATWVVLGYQGIPQFEKLRRNAIKKTKQARSERNGPKPVAMDCDWFHDGKNVLADVTDWHQVLRGSARKTDTVTSQVLDLVDQKMLCGSAEERYDANSVCKVLTEVLSRCTAEPREVIPENVISALLEVDETAPTIIVTTPSEVTAKPDQGHFLRSPQERKARKSSRLDGLLMKTANRSECLKNVLNNPLVEAPNLNMSNDSSAVNGGPQPPYATPEAPSAYITSEESHIRANNGRSLDKVYSDVLPRLNDRRQTSKTHEPQNVWQAREAIEVRQQAGFFKKSRKDELLSKHFENRDIKFLVDNASSMEQHWYHATYLLQTLVLKAKGQDENGMDLTFTGGTVKLENRGKSSAFVSAMKKAQPHPLNRTNMKAALEGVFSAYMLEFKTKPHKRKDMTLIVLTDGLWDGMTDKHEVENKVVDFVEHMRKWPDYLKERSVSIAFIQFGDNANATYRLRQLDRNLKWRGIPDIIDTEPATGDVNKMLLGSFVEEYDVDDEDDEEDPGTPGVRPESPYRASRILSPEHFLQTSPPHASPFQPPSKTASQSTGPPFHVQNHHRPKSGLFSRR